MSEMRQLVSKAELLWVLDALEPALTSNLAPQLPIDQNSTYVRLRHLERVGLVAAEAIQGDETTYRWSLTDLGREQLAAADLPAASTVDFGTYFAGRAASIDPVMVLEALAAPEHEWVASSAVYERLPFSKQGIQDNLHALVDAGDVELDPGSPGMSHHWRLTESGRTRLARATPGDSPEYAWLD
jgi:DNA-binding HxlR family transcriptional regulator